MAKNKLQKFDDMAGYAHVFQYPFEELRVQGFPLKGRWGMDFFHNDHPIVIELGCGRGEYTVGLAKRYPNKNFIGIDIKGARMWTGATDSLREGLNNVAFLRTKIELITSFFEANEVSEIWITFPDPQMKKANKRMTSTRFLQRYTEILADGGLVHLKCDSNFLYTYTMEVARANGLRIIGNSNNLYFDCAIDVEAKEKEWVDIEALRGIRTYYEEQWLSRGIEIKYLGIQLFPQNEWTEPEVEIELDPYRSFGRNKRSALTTHV